MEIALKYGKLATKPNRRNVDAEMTLMRPYMFILCLLSYVMLLQTFFVPVQQGFVLVNVNFVIFLVTMVPLLTTQPELVDPSKTISLPGVPSPYNHDTPQ